MVRRIVSQDAFNQYDEDGNAITTWNNKYCGWVINREYESDTIDWQDNENGISEFPRGATEAYYKELYPNADKFPVIKVTWHWDEEGYIKAFKTQPTGDWRSYTNSWEYLDYSEDRAIKLLGHYCNFNKYAFKTEVVYNGKTIFEGKLE